MSDCEHCGATLADHAVRCGLCLAPVRRSNQPAAPQRRVWETDRFARAEYSRWRGGPTSFGPAVKVAITVCVLAMGPIGGMAGFRVLWLIAWGPVAIFILAATWRKQRVS